MFKILETLLQPIFRLSLKESNTATLQSETALLGASSLNKDYFHAHAFPV